MDRHPLGNTGLNVPVLGLGTVKIGRNTDVKYPVTFDLPDDQAVDRVLQSAHALGVGLLDTAPAYGESERRLGAWLRTHDHDFMLCSKCGETYGADGSRYDFSAAALEASVRGSLRDLGTDSLDILLLHSDGRDERILKETDAVDTLRRLKAEGLTRTVGISAKTSEGILLAIECLDVVMAPVNETTHHLDDALGAAREQGVGVLAIKCLESGHAAADGDDAAGRALRSVFRRGFVDCAIVGTLNPEHLRQAVESVFPAASDS